jgi:hypothetical protein
MKKEKAYCLFAQDNNASFFDGAPKSVFCPKCDSVIKPDYRPTRLDIAEKGSTDLSFTTDGRPIVSEHFKVTCENNGYEIDFFLLDGEKHVYLPSPRRTVRFDATRRKTRFVDKCPLCGRYESVVGATPAFLDEPDGVGRGIYRTDLEFGSGREKFPMIVVGSVAMQILESAGLKGLEYVPVRD